VRLRSVTRPINEVLRALRRRGATAEVAAVLDARPKIVAPKKGKASYRRDRQPPPDSE
jgi:hypothetical protein